MELRAYWNTVRRWWWLVLGTAALVAVVSTLLQPQVRETYSSTVLVAARPVLDPYRGGYAPNQERYYGTLNMELFWDDVSRTVKSGEFAEAVRRDLVASAGGRSIAGGFDTKKEHRLLALTSTGNSPEDAQVLANTAAKLLVDPVGPAREWLREEIVTLTVVAPAGPGAPSSRVGGTLNLGLRVLLGLIAGAALAFLMDYLDDTLRTAREAQEALGLPILGEIPLR